MLNRPLPPAIRRCRACAARFGFRAKYGVGTKSTCSADSFVVAVNPPRVVLRDAPLRRATASCATSNVPFFSRRRSSCSDGVDPVVHRPQQAVGVVLDVASRAGRKCPSRAPSCPPCRSPLVSRISQRFGGSPTSTPSVEHLERARQDQPVGRTPSACPSSRRRSCPRARRCGRWLDPRRWTGCRHVAGHLDGPHAALGDPSRSRPDPESAARWPPARADSRAAGERFDGGIRRERCRHFRRRFQSRCQEGLS